MDSKSYTWFDNGWSKGCFTSIMMAWDSGINGFLYVKIVHGLGMNQWHIWDPSIVCSDRLG